MDQPIYETGHQMGPYPNIIICLILGAFPLAGICLIVLAIYTSVVEIRYDGYSMIFALLFFALVIGAAFFFLILGWAFISGGLARYRFDQAGLEVRYPLHEKQLIPWDAFQQVCICYAAYTTRGERRANTVICCVMKGEKKNGLNRWKTDNPFHYRSVICIDYSPGLHEGIKERCPLEVVDLRQTLTYRLDL